MALKAKGFWLKLYPIRISDGATVELRFCSVNRPSACYIEGDSLEYKPYMEGNPVFGIKVFDGDFDGSAEVTLDQLEISSNNSYVANLNATYVWDGAEVKLYKGNADDTSFASLTQIWAGVVSKAPDIDENVAKFSFEDLDYMLDKPFLSAKYAGTGGIEGPSDLTGVYKPVIFGYPLSVQPILIDAAYVIFQYDGGLGYQRCSAISGVYENGLSFGAATATVAWQGSAAATYTALQNVTLTLGQWADAPSIGCFRLGGEPKSNGVVCCDPNCNTQYIDDVLAAVIPQSGVSASVLDASNRSTFRAATGNQVISDFITEQKQVLEMMEGYLSEVGGYQFWTQTGGIRFGLIRFSTPTLTIESDGSTSPIVTEISCAPVSAPYKRLRIGADRCFRVHGPEEVSDALLDQVLAVQNSLTTLQNQVYSAADDGILTGAEKNQVIVPQDSNLANFYTALTGRATALGLTYTALTNARNAYLSARNAMSPAWNDTTQDTDISSITPPFRNLMITYADELKKLEVSISQKDAQLADWNQTSNIPANLDALVGTEAINNQLILNSIAADDMISRTEKIGTLNKLAGDLENRYNDLLIRATVLGLSTTAMSGARTDWKSFLTNYNVADVSVDTEIYPSGVRVYSVDGLFAGEGWDTANISSIADDGLYKQITDSDAANFKYVSRYKTIPASGTLVTQGIAIKKDSIPASTRCILIRPITVSAVAGTKYTDIVMDTSTGEYISGQVNGGTAGWIMYDLGDEFYFVSAIITPEANTTIGIDVYPAISTGLSSGFSQAVTGSVSIRNHRACYGWTSNLGRSAFTGALGYYSKTMVQMAKAISEVDGSTTDWVDGPTSANVLYNSTGSAIEANVDLDYVLKAGVGIAITSGVTAVYRVLEGTVNGFDSNSSDQSITLTSGVGTLSISSLGTATAKVQIRMTRSGLTKTLTLALTKTFSPPVSGGGSGGSGGSDVPDQTSGFTNLLNTSYIAITNTLTFTMPTGKSTLRCLINLNCKMTLKNSCDQPGPWNVQFKVQRGGVDQGSVQNSNPDPYMDQTSEGFIISNSGTLYYQLDMGGLTAGVQYSIVVYALISSGTLPTNGSQLNFTGSVTLSAP